MSQQIVSTKSRTEAIQELLEEIRKVENLTPEKLSKLKKETGIKYSLSNPPTNIELLTSVKKEELSLFKSKLLSKPTRTISGVAPVAIMTAPFACPHGKCTFCPGGPNSSFGDVPQSYTGHEPTTMRAIRNHYDPYLQVFNRLEHYIVIGQNPNKVELIVMGGTFPALTEEYQNTFVLDSFRAMNDFSELFFKKNEFDFEEFKNFFELPGDIGNKERTENIHAKIIKIKTSYQTNLEKEQKRNETAEIRCVAMCIETKPDWGKLAEGNRMLLQGCTRVELGVESVYEEVLKKTNRGHTLQDTKDSFRILRDLGFKISAHSMPGLPLTDRKRDLEGMKELFSNPDYRPDMLKIYPCMVSPGTALYPEWKKGAFKPLTTDEAASLIAEFKPFIPTYCRVQRINRDVPTKFWSDGVGQTNLRQYLHDKYKPKCRCIRCREPKNNQVNFDKVEILVQEFEASKGKEFFISAEDTSNDIILGFCRLRFPSQQLRKEITLTTAIIRELHVYGTAVPLGDKGTVQHKGYGKLLLAKAEQIALENGKNKMAIISGIGVKEYYRKLGYSDDGVYVSKQLN